MFKKSWKWWFGKNSLWQQSGVGSAFNEGISSTVGGGGSFLSGLGTFFSGGSQPQVQVDHGLSDNMKIAIGVGIAYLIFRK